VGKRAQKAQAVDPQDLATESGAYRTPWRRPAGRKPGPAPECQTFGEYLKAVVAHCFPELIDWLDALPDPRRQDMCVYTGAHLWFEILLTFLLRGGSRNAFDVDRNSGAMPGNMLQLCGQAWDEARLGPRQTVTCSGNATHHAGRVPVADVAQIPLKMVRRLLQMRLLDSARLLDSWWLIAVDGTLQERGRKRKGKAAHYRYVLTASLIGPEGLTLPLLTEFVEVRGSDYDKEDCELNAFVRLAARLQRHFPRLPLCLLADGLYPVQRVFDLCQEYGWKFIFTLREGRQRLAYDEAVQTMLMNPQNLSIGRRQGEDGSVDQTLRWTDHIPFGAHRLQVLFSGEVSPAQATLWVWVTNLHLDASRVYAIANHGGRLRQWIETLFNVEKNGGFGLEHTFCVNETASQNYHLIMQAAAIVWQLLAKGLLHRLTRLCRKVTDIKLVALLHASLLFVPLPRLPSPRIQLRFLPAPG